MNTRIKRATLAVGVLALAAVFLVPVFRNNAYAGQPANAAVLTSPGYTDTAVASSTPEISTPNSGSYAPQDFRNYMYGMMGAMMGGYWNYQGNSGQSTQGNYPYYGMMGGYWGYPGQTVGPYTPPQDLNSNGGVSGNVYGTQSN